MIQDFSATLTKKTHLAGEVIQFHFEIEEDIELEFIGGQYVLLKVDNVYRQYSISSSDAHRSGFELIVGIVPNGVASTYLAALNEGEKAHFKGPAGVFVRKNTSTPKIFLATGTGIAPIKSMISSYFDENEQGSLTMRLFFGLRYEKDIYLREFFEDIHAKHASFAYSICLSGEDKSASIFESECFACGRVDVQLKAYLLEHQRSSGDPSFQISANAFEYYICGSQKSVEGIKSYVLKDLGVSPENVFFEKFT